MKYYINGKEVTLANLNGEYVYMDVETNQVIGSAAEIKADADASEETGSIGKQLAYCRQSKGLTLDKVVAISGINKQSISRAELNKQNMRIDLLIRLLDLYDMELTITPKLAKQ